MGVYFQLRKGVNMTSQIKIVLASFIFIFSTGVFALEAGQSAPCVVLDHTQGGRDSEHCIRDPQVKDKPVVIEFFSITCSDCQKNLPQIKKLAQQLQGKATIRLVSIDRNVTAVRQYIVDNNIQMEVAFDSERNARKAYEVVSTPTLFVLDKTNTIIEKHSGVLSDAVVKELVSKIERL
jgi:thiol-disulfide isomerase/thioredoxin